MNQALINYLAKHIIPMYATFDAAHRESHIQQVIQNSFEIVSELNLDVDKNIVYTVAAYHDLGLCIERKSHEQRSKEMVLADKQLTAFFSGDEIQIIAEAAEDHRASNKSEPRSIYGAIVSEADRDIDYYHILKRCIQYNLATAHHQDKEMCAHEVYLHITEKYIEGNMKFWLKWSKNIDALQMLKERISDKEVYLQDFARLYQEVCSEGNR